MNIFSTQQAFALKFADLKVSDLPTQHTLVVRPKTNPSCYAIVATAKN
jgi:hypothetical protein